jgi:hypothetical protein
MNLTVIKRGVAIAVVVGVGAAVATGLKVLGSPAEARARKLDEQRVSDLQQLANTLDSYRTRHGHLAESTEVAAREFDLVVVLRDPLTNQRYDYRILSQRSYELCADFQRASQLDPRFPHVGFWSHGAGHHCFEITARELSR